MRRRKGAARTSDLECALAIATRVDCLRMRRIFRSNFFSTFGGREAQSRAFSRMGPRARVITFSLLQDRHAVVAAVIAPISMVARSAVASSHRARLLALVRPRAVCEKFTPALARHSRRSLVSDLRRRRLFAHVVATSFLWRRPRSVGFLPMNNFCGRVNAGCPV